MSVSIGSVGQHPALPPDAARQCDPYAPPSRVPALQVRPDDTETKAAIDVLQGSSACYICAAAWDGGQQWVLACWVQRPVRWRRAAAGSWVQAGHGGCATPGNGMQAHPDRACVSPASAPTTPRHSQCFVFFQAFFQAPSKRPPNALPHALPQS